MARSHGGMNVTSPIETGQLMPVPSHKATKRPCHTPRGSSPGSRLGNRDDTRDRPTILMVMRKATLAFVFLALEVCTEAPQRDEPVIVRAEQLKSLVGEWANDAILAARDAACPEEKPGRFGWTTRAIKPPSNDAGTVLPDKMTGTVECDDGSHHAVVVLFAAPVREEAVGSHSSV